MTENPPLDEKLLGLVAEAGDDSVLHVHHQQCIRSHQTSLCCRAAPTGRSGSSTTGREPQQAGELCDRAHSLVRIGPHRLPSHHRLLPVSGSGYQPAAA